MRTTSAEKWRAKQTSIDASVALQFGDAMVHDVDHITTMLDDPTADTGTACIQGRSACPT